MANRRATSRARTGATRQEARDIATRDQQHSRREQGEHGEKACVLRGLRDPGLEFGPYGEPSIAVRLGVSLFQIVRNHRQFGLRRLPRHTGLEASLDREVAETARIKRTKSGIGHEARPHHQGRVELEACELIHASELGRGDADDRELDTVETHGSAKNGAICAELMLPEIVAENQHGIAARYLALFGPKGTSQLGLDSHDREEIAADEHAHPEGRQRVGLSGEPHGAAGEGNQSIECLAAIPDVEIVRVRADHHSESLDHRGRADCQHFAGTGHGQRPQQHGVSRTERRTICADANRQGNDGGGGKGRILQHHAPGIAKVLSDCLEWVQGPPLSVRFHRSHHAPETAVGRSSGFSGIHAGLDVVVGPAFPSGSESQCPVRDPDAS
jgi:hypothetical protein